MFCPSCWVQSSGQTLNLMGGNHYNFWFKYKFYPAHIIQIQPDFHGQRNSVPLFHLFSPGLGWFSAAMASAAIFSHTADSTFSKSAQIPHTGSWHHSGQQ